MSNQSPAEALRQQLETIVDKHIVEWKAGHGHLIIKQLEQAVTAYAATVEREARIDEVRVPLDKINNYKPDPNAMSFGSASGAMENAGWKHYFEARLAALQGPIQGDAPDHSESQTP